MLLGLVCLIACQFIGEAVVRLLNVPVPGPVVGLVLLAVPLLVARRTPPGIEQTSDTLLRHLSLFFVPAGVGALRYADLLAQEGVRLAIVLVASTAATMAVTALTFRFVASHARRERT